MAARGERGLEPRLHFLSLITKPNGPSTKSRIVTKRSQTYAVGSNKSGRKHRVVAVSVRIASMRSTLYSVRLLSCIQRTPQSNSVAQRGVRSERPVGLDVRLLVVPAERPKPRAGMSPKVFRHNIGILRITRTSPLNIPQQKRA